MMRVSRVRQILAPGGVLVALAGPQTALAQRSVEGNALVSDQLPPVELAVDSTLAYVGGQDFILYGVAHVEQHFFAEVDGSRVKRLLWVQFEGYLSSNRHTYDYSEHPVMEIDGHPFHHNAGFFSIPDVEPRPESDGAKARQLLRANGLEVGPDVMYQRLVWLLDQPPRNELMIIYLEDLEDHGIAVADLEEGGEAAGRWDEVAAGLRERALSAFEIENR